MPNFVESKILLQNPEVLFPGYLQIRAEWKADKKKGGIEIEEFCSPQKLADAMECYAKEPLYEKGSKLKWEILFTFGYQALKRHYEYCEELVERQIATSRSGLEELGPVDAGFLLEFGELTGDEPDLGPTFPNGIPPD